MRRGGRDFGVTNIQIGIRSTALLRRAECLTTALTLDWKRFSSEQITDFCKMEADALREFSDLPTTTNMMGFFKGVDYNTLKNAS